MKTTVKHLATGTFLALLLIVANVKAEGTEIKALAGKSIETTLQFEKWMTDATVWNTNSETFADIVQTTESDLKLEDWMTNEEIWNSNFSAVEETDAGLELESWMINDASWNADNIQNDPKLNVEFWMMNENYWK